LSVMHLPQADLSKGLTLMSVISPVFMPACLHIISHSCRDRFSFSFRIAGTSVSCDSSSGKIGRMVCIIAMVIVSSLTKNRESNLQILCSDLFSNIKQKQADSKNQIDPPSDELIWLMDFQHMKVF
ncbi:MAG: hypothetical protein IJM63_08350, partial [Solobacterium sp.]|nr:hypothetical protein [Solobacterium sp.]